MHKKWCLLVLIILNKLHNKFPMRISVFQKLLLYASKVVTAIADDALL